MLFINIFNYKEYFFPVLLKCIILILRSSPELLLNKYQNQQNDDEKISFLFTIIEGTLNFRIIISTLSNFFLYAVTFFFLLTVASIFISKKGIFGFQIVSNLLFPIQVYMTVSSLNNDNLSKGQMAGFGVLLIISFIIILSKFLVFDFRTDSPLIVKSFAKSFQLLSQIIMVLSGVMSFFLNDNTKVAILLILMGLNLLKTYILYYYICFQSPLIEYTVYLCDPLSWISLLTSFLSLVYGINTPYLIWGYFCFIIGGVFIQNSILRYLIEKKYISFFRKQFSFNPNRNKQKIQDIQENLIIYLCLLKAGLKLKDKTVANESFLRFSEQFVHQICTSLIKFQKAISKRVQKTNNNTSTAQSSEKRIDLNVLRNLQFKFQNQHQYAQKYWNIIKEMPQLQDEQFKKLRRFAIYTLPQISNAFQARIVYIYYLSHRKESKQQKRGKLTNRLHFIDDLHQQIDYNFVVEQTKNRKIQQFLVQSKKNAQGEIITSGKSESQYCLKTELSYGSSFFEEFYIQTVYEQTLQKKFQQFYSTQKQIIEIVDSIHSTVDNLTEKLLKINQIKSEVFTIINECPQVQSKQFNLQQYILSKYILKLPYLAKEKLRISQQDDDNQKIKQPLVMDSQKVTSKTLQRVQMAENEGILLMSAVRDKGSIIYGTTNIRQVLQIKSGLNLDNNEKNNQMVHINHFILPCWIGQHNQAMQSIAIYEKPFHHLGPKYHMKSIISKNIYQIQFTMHFLTCNMSDLIVAMDLKYKLVQSLSITKNGQKIFSYSWRQNRIDRENSLGGQAVKMEEQIDEGNYLTQPYNYAQKKRVQTCEQMLFGEQYQITTRYSEQFEDEITAMEGATFSSYIQQSESQMVKGQTSVWEFTSYQQQKRIMIEKKLNYYRKNKFLYRKDYLIVIGIIVVLCAVLIILTAVLANILILESHNHMQFYQFRHMMQNQYFLTDLKSFNSFLMLFLPLTPYIKFSSNSSILDFQILWDKIFVEEINALQTRGASLSSNQYDSNLTLELQFKNLNGISTTFLFQEQEFQIHYFNIFDQLNLSSISSNGTSTAIFPNPYKDLNLAQQSTLNGLYLQSLNRYYEYLQPNGVFRTLLALNSKLIDQQNSKLKIIYSFIVVILLVGIISFGILYIRYLNNLSEFTSALFELPNQTITSLKMELQEFKIITQQSKKTSDYNPYNGLKSCKTISVKNKTIFIRKSQKNKVIKQIKKSSSFKSNWKAIILLALYVLVFLVLLYESYIQANTEINLFQKYLSGTSTLAQTSGKSINIFSWLMDAIFYPSHPLSPQIPVLINQLKQVDLLTTMQALQPNPTDLQLSLFSSWYDNGYMKIIFFDLLQAKRTLMQSFTMSIQLYEIVYSKLSTQPRGTLIDSKLIIQMYKEISHSTQMIRELLNKAQANYFDVVPEVNVYLILIIIAIFLFSILIVYWSHNKLYNTTKAIFEETLSFTTIKDLLHVPTLAFHLYESDKQNIFKNSVKNLK